MERILIIEDEVEIAELEKDYLELSGFDVDLESNGKSGCSRALAGDYDLLILDLMLPDMDGFDICKAVRGKKNIPIIMVSAKKSDIDKIRGLGNGADDYMTKPFSIREVIARVKANLRKHTLPEVEEEKNSSKNKIKVKDMIIDPERYIAIVGGKTIDLTIKEFELLKLLATNPNQVFTREQILRGVWGYDFYGDARTVDVTVRRLREKIEKNSAEPQYVQTKRGMGYYVSL